MSRYFALGARPPALSLRKMFLFGMLFKYHVTTQQTLSILPNVSYQDASHRMVSSDHKLHQGDQDGA